MRRIVWLCLLLTLCSYACQTNDRDGSVNVPGEPTSVSNESESTNHPSALPIDYDQEITLETVDGAYTLVFHTQDALDQWAASAQNREWTGDAKAVRFDEGVKKIPAETFAHLPIEEVFFPASLSEIDDYAFYRCDALEQIHWQEGIRRIGKYAFEGTAIKELILPNGLASIGSDAFSEMPNLQVVYLPDSVEDLSYAFINCPKLERIRLSTNVEILHADFLTGASALRELTVPAGVQIIDLDLAAHGGVQRIIFEGSPLLICRLNIKDYPALKQIVFCSEPPAQDMELMTMIEDGGLGIYGSEQCTLYYLNSCTSSWAPNGETVWNGFPIVAIDSLETLPSIE